MYNELKNYILEYNLENISFLDILPKLSEKTKKSILHDLSLNSKTSDKNNTYYIFTDGGCKRNGHVECKAAYSVIFPNNPDLDRSQILLTNPTNNRAELSGILYIFKTVQENKDIFQNKDIIICTDSMYSINCIEKWSKNWCINDWKNAKGQDVKNKEIIQEILNYRDKLLDINIKFNHIFSHTAPPTDKNSLQYYLWNGNNQVDQNICKLLAM